MCTMKKLLLLLVLVPVVVCLCSCGEQTADTKTSASEFTVILPKDDTVNGYRTKKPLTEQEDNTSSDNKNNTSNQSHSDGYFINTSTKKFHSQSCRYAKQGSKNGKNVTQSRQELVNQGYSPCKVCNP